MNKHHSNPNSQQHNTRPQASSCIQKINLIFTSFPQLFSPHHLLCRCYKQESKLSNEVCKKYEIFTMNQNQTLSLTFGIPKVGRNLGSTICNVNRAILQMTKDMARSNVNIDHFKKVALKNGIQLILILGQLFFKHGVPK